MATRKKKPEAPVFSKAELLENAAALGTSRELLAGALYGVEEATLDEAKKLLEKFKKGVIN